MQGKGTRCTSAVAMLVTVTAAFPHQQPNPQTSSCNPAAQPDWNNTNPSRNCMYAAPLDLSASNAPQHARRAQNCWQQAHLQKLKPTSKT